MPAEGSSSIWQSTGLQNRRLGVRVPPALLPTSEKTLTVSMNRQQRRLIQRQGPLAEESLTAPEPAPAEPEEPRPVRTAVLEPPRRRWNPRQFLHEVNVELRKVAWPTRAETMNYATVVFIALAVLMALIFVLDLGFSNLADFLFK
jgi:preprotein translocase subunit SecE